MAVALEDFMRRRSDLMLFGPGNGLGAAGTVAGVMDSTLTWGSAERKRQVSAYRDAIARMMSFRVRGDAEDRTEN
jgi:glycerol-3-phosphate dehydrogenase